jgi:hypothetical protein
MALTAHAVASGEASDEVSKQSDEASCVPKW